MTFKQRIARIKCWWRGYHVADETHVAKFRYDVSGMCHDCGKVGDGITIWGG
jgi:hypothetical protein